MKINLYKQDYYIQYFTKDMQRLVDFVITLFLDRWSEGGGVGILGGRVDYKLTTAKY